MIFEIETVARCYPSETAEKLKRLGFEFEAITAETMVKTKDIVCRDFESIEAILTFTNDWSPTQEVIITADRNPPRLTIFDDYVS